MIKRKPSGRASGAAASGASSPTSAKDSSDPSLARVRELARIATEFDLGEVELDSSGRIRISRLRTSAAPVGAIAAAPAPGPSAPTLVKTPPAEEDGGVFVMSPFVGTFYRSPSPEAGPFVDVGSVVRKGQVVCIIEAMKLMNEIESEVDGKVSEVLVNNGEHVEYGQKLFRVSKA